jgi:hypothetical protein
VSLVGCDEGRGETGQLTASIPRRLSTGNC